MSMNKRLAAWIGIVTTVGVIAIALLVVALHKSGSPAPEEPVKQPKPIPDFALDNRADARPSCDGGAAQQSNLTRDDETDKEHPAEKWLGQDVKEHRVVTNGTLIVETFVTADGKSHKYYHDEREKTLPTAADQILAMMTAENGGFGAPPLPQLADFEGEFRKALELEIAIADDDPPETKALKERVIAARAEMKELLAQGMSAEQVVADWQKMQEDNATIRFEAARMVREMLDSGDIEGAKMLCDRCNKVLENAGIMPLEIPAEY